MLIKSTPFAVTYYIQYQFKISEKNAANVAHVKNTGYISRSLLNFDKSYRTYSQLNVLLRAKNSDEMVTPNRRN
jgi:hypothetical protein